MEVIGREMEKRWRKVTRPRTGREICRGIGVGAGENRPSRRVPTERKGGDQLPFLCQSSL